MSVAKVSGAAGFILAIVLMFLIVEWTHIIIYHPKISEWIREAAHQ